MLLIVDLAKNNWEAEPYYENVIFGIVSGLTLLFALLILIPLM